MAARIAAVSAACPSKQTAAQHITMPSTVMNKSEVLSALQGDLDVVVKDQKPDDSPKRTTATGMRTC
jgi:hypothetical protein